MLRVSTEVRVLASIALLALVACSAARPEGEPALEGSPKVEPAQEAARPTELEPLMKHGLGSFRHQLTADGNHFWIFEPERDGMAKIHLCDTVSPSRLAAVPRHSETNQAWYDFESDEGRCHSHRWPVHEGDRWVVEIKGPASVEYTGELSLNPLSSP